MMGIEYLWGGPVGLETYELTDQKSGGKEIVRVGSGENEFLFKKVQYRMENKKLTKKEG